MLPMTMGERIMPMFRTISMEAIASPEGVSKDHAPLQRNSKSMLTLL